MEQNHIKTIMSNIKVGVRCRMLNKREIELKSSSIISKNYFKKIEIKKKSLLNDIKICFNNKNFFLQSNENDLLKIFFSIFKVKLNEKILNYENEMIGCGEYHSYIFNKSKKNKFFN
jgi:hypothetical protein